jgi:hypothetical protein
MQGLPVGVGHRTSVLPCPWLRVEPLPLVGVTRLPIGYPGCARNDGFLARACRAGTRGAASHFLLSPRPGPATTSVGAGSGHPSRAETRKPHGSAVSEALCRTRTGDPFLTMAVGCVIAMADAEPKRLHRLRNATPQRAASIRTLRQPPVPRGYLGLAPLEERAESVRGVSAGCPSAPVTGSAGR